MVSLDDGKHVDSHDVSQLKKSMVTPIKPFRDGHTF